MIRVTHYPNGYQAECNWTTNDPHESKWLNDMFEEAVHDPSALHAQKALREHPNVQQDGIRTRLAMVEQKQRALESNFKVGSFALLAIAVIGASYQNWESIRGSIPEKLPDMTWIRNAPWDLADLIRDSWNRLN